MSKDLQNILNVKPCHSGHDMPSVQNPDITTALRIANEIIETASLDVPRTAKHLAVTSEECKGIRNVNIPFDETIYRDLVDLSVEDEHLTNSKSLSKQKKSIPSKTKDITPCLHDYRVPQYSVPHVFEAKSEPPPKQMIRRYNGKEMYELFAKIRGSDL